MRKIQFHHESSRNNVEYLDMLFTIMIYCQIKSNPFEYNSKKQMMTSSYILMQDPSYKQEITSSSSSPSSPPLSITRYPESVTIQDHPVPITFEPR